MELLLDLLKFTIPALFVFLTAYFLLRGFFQNEFKIRMLEFQKNNKDEILPLRLQAYERLTLFCERMQLPKMILRLRDDQLSAGAFKLLLLTSIEQEFEHNVTQQMYMSPKLWEIIQFAKNEATSIVAQVGNEINPNEPSVNLSKAIYTFLETSPQQGADKAQLAIKTEVQSLF